MLLVVHACAWRSERYLSRAVLTPLRELRARFRLWRLPAARHRCARTVQYDVCSCQAACGLCGPALTSSCTWPVNGDRTKSVVWLAGRMAPLRTLAAPSEELPSGQRSFFWLPTEQSLCGNEVFIGFEDRPQRAAIGGTKSAPRCDMGKNQLAKKAKKADAPDVVDSSEEEQNRRGRGDGRGHVDSSDEEAWQNAQRAIARKRAESVKLEADAPGEGEAEAVTAPPLTGGEESAGGAAAGDAAGDATVSADEGVLQQPNGVAGGVAGSAEAGGALVDGAQGQAEAETASDLGGGEGGVGGAAAGDAVASTDEGALQQPNGVGGGVAGSGEAGGALVMRARTTARIQCEFPTHIGA